MKQSCVKVFRIVSFINRWLFSYFLQSLQQQNLSLPQFVLVQPGHPIATSLQPQFIISQAPQAQQGRLICCAAELQGEMYSSMAIEAFV